VQALVISLMVCSTPVINSDEHAEIMQQVNLYTDLSIVMSKSNSNVDASTVALSSIAHARSQHTGEILAIPSWVTNTEKSALSRNMVNGTLAHTVEMTLAPSTPKAGVSAKAKAEQEKKEQETYETLAITIDKFVESEAAKDLFVVASDNFSIAQQLSYLTDSNIDIRARRDKGIALASDIRQFAFNQYLEYTLAKSPHVDSASSSKTLSTPSSTHRKKSTATQSSGTLLMEEMPTHTEPDVNQEKQPSLQIFIPPSGQFTNRTALSSTREFDGSDTPPITGVDLHVIV
jgi:hypothetical protein